MNKDNENIILRKNSTIFYTHNMMTYRFLIIIIYTIYVVEKSSAQYLPPLQSCNISLWNVGMIGNVHSADPGDIVNFSVSGAQYNGSIIEFFFASDVYGSSLNNMYIRAKKNGLIKFSTSKLLVPNNQLCSLSPWKEKQPWSIVANITVLESWSGQLVIARLASNSNYNDTNSITQYWYLTIRDKFKYDTDNSPSIAVMYNLFTNDIAYNGYGGYSFYSGPHALKNGMTFSLYRPTVNNIQTDGNLQIFSWLKQKGITDVQAFNDLDLHFRCNEIKKSKIWILTLHPEYWTLREKQCLEDYLENGGRMIYLAANGIYRRVEIDEVLKDTIQYQYNNTFTINGHIGEIGGEWENIAEKSKQSAKLTGGLYKASLTCIGGAYIIEQPDHWAFNKARDLLSADLFKKGLQFAGTVVPPENYGCIEIHILSKPYQINPNNLVTPLGAAGWEIDSLMEDSPKEYDLIGTSTQTKDPIKGAILMYFRKGKGCVFSSNSMVSPWGLHNDMIFSGMIEGVLETMLENCPNVENKIQWGMWILLSGCLLFMIIGGIFLARLIIK